MELLVITDPEHAEEWRQRNPMLPSIVLEPGRAYVFGCPDDGAVADPAQK